MSTASERNRARKGALGCLLVALLGGLLAAQVSGCGTDDDQARAASANGARDGLNPLLLIAVGLGTVMAAGLIFGVWRRTRAK